MDFIRPAAMALYVEDEQKDAAEEQYTDTLSPPLLRAVLYTSLLAASLALVV